MITRAMPAPLRIFLVRHGQTAWNAERRLLGRTDIPLDDTGVLQARGVADALARAGVRPAALVSSPLRRAAATAQAISATLDVAVRHDPDLAEMDQGTLEGVPADVLRRDHAALFAAWRADPGAVTLPGGESFGAVQQRARLALHRAVDGAAPGSTLVVVSHQLVLGALLCEWTDTPLSGWSRWAHRNTAWSELAWEDPPRVVAHDQAPHLEGS
ncbi:MAG: hypothetical protein RLZZ299_2435 [Pseudomonadota bacterium]